MEADRDEAGGDVLHTDDVAVTVAIEQLPTQAGPVKMSDHAQVDAEATTRSEATEAVTAAAAPVEGDTASSLVAAPPTADLERVSSPTSSSAPIAQKKFTSLNVNKRFLEKASPMVPAAAVPVVSKTSAPSTSSRLSAISPASRLTSAKLSNAMKPQPAGWGQFSAALSPSAASPNADPLPSANTGMGGASSSSKAGTAANAPVLASPKLVTALTSGSAHRSTSPHNKGSPGLRNAALAASGRTASPSSSVPSMSGSSKVPWAKVKADAPPSSLSTDFPTAAEAAAAKAEAERREKAAAAEAAAKAEQALQHLERFRGASLGSGNHWDEMDDLDDLDEVVQFGDGTQYKVPVKKEEEPVSKEERFKDVGHDRSWPPRASQAVTAAAAAPRPALATRSSSTREDAAHHPSSDTAALRPSHKTNTKMEIRSGEGISLDSEVLNPTRESRPFFRRDREDHPHHATAHTPAPVTSAPARAWGPLAQRQASLNPDAPRPPVSSPPVNHFIAAATQTATTPTSAPLHSIKSPSRRSAAEAASLPSPAVLLRQADAPTSQPAPGHGSKDTGSERALPPHLAASHAAPQRSAPSNTSLASRMEVQATPYGTKVSAEKQQLAQSPSVPQTPPSASKHEEPVSAKVTANKADTQREEMLSAAERARKRRQEEEEKYQAERERARAKAAALEEKMRLAKEEQDQKKKEEEDKRRREMQEAEERRKAEAEEARKRQASATAAAAAAKEKERVAWKERSESVASPEAPAKRPALLSPSDEAVSWRRGKVPSTVPPVAPQKVEVDQFAFADVRPVPQQMTLLQRPASSKGHNARIAVENRTKNEIKFAASTGMEGWGDVVLNRMKAEQIPTGPRAANKQKQPDVQHTEVVVSQPQVKLPVRSPRVEIIAPTDEGAARQRAVEKRQREARQTAGVQSKPVSALKAATTGPPEALTTRTEMPLESMPVWNKFKVKLGPAPPFRRLPRHLVKAQAIRMANAGSDRTPKPVDILTWDPPIANLSTRTLSRDDQLNPKRYCKGVIITHVAIPTASLEPGKTSQRVDTKETLVVKMPSARQAPPAMAITSPDPPTAPASMRTKAAYPSTITETMPRSANARRRSSSARDSSGAVAFARSLGARENTPSPVSFMVTSELSKDNSLSVPNATAASSSTSMISSPSMMASTWGQSSLTFAGIDAGGEQSNATADRDHIREVWNKQNSSRDGNKQNSLRGVEDEFPEVAAQYHDVGISTGETQSAPTSRLYSPLTSRVEEHNGFASMTSASSPSTSKSSPPTRVSLNGGNTPITSTKSDGRFASDNRRVAFAPYAYPFQEFAPAEGYLEGQQQQLRGFTSQPFYPQQQQQQNYGQLDSNYGGGMSYSPYRGSTSPGGVSMMAGAGWPVDNAASPGVYQNAQQPHHHHHHQQHHRQQHPAMQQSHQQRFVGPNSRNHHTGSSAGSMRGGLPAGGATNPYSSRGGGAGGNMRSFRPNDPSSAFW